MNNVGTGTIHWLSTLSFGVSPKVQLPNRMREESMRIIRVQRATSPRKAKFYMNRKKESLRRFLVTP